MAGDTTVEYGGIVSNVPSLTVLVAAQATFGSLRIPSLARVLFLNVTVAETARFAYITVANITGTTAISLTVPKISGGRVALSGQNAKTWAVSSVQIMYEFVPELSTAPLVLLSNLWGIGDCIGCAGFVSVQMNHREPWIYKNDELSSCHGRGVLETEQNVSSCRCFAEVIRVTLIVCGAGVSYIPGRTSTSVLLISYRSFSFAFWTRQTKAKIVMESLAVLVAASLLQTQCSVRLSIHSAIAFKT